MSKKYRVLVTTYGYYEVDASSKEEAYEIAHNGDADFTLKHEETEDIQELQSDGSWGVV